MTTTGNTATPTSATPTSATPTPWSAFEAAEPAFARGLGERFAAFRHHVLATVRADGAPRASGIEAIFSLGELWLGGMPGARKSADLVRDPRFALHANPGPGTDMHGGDARVAGRALLVDDPDVRRRFAEEVDPPTPFDLFRVELTEAVRVRVEDEEMVLELWRPDGRGLRVLRRGNDDAPAREEPATPGGAGGIS
ncbi:pyridoxamine 5'-phosphate oxidase family protein [Parafrankia elaeagni]|uniref:pyridoxamine 5'-phosphate oxidase family protein n=1 Tax=Parafrankia elaeagni TaxID=222534 RepID=UPI000368B855|nr:pyridoxamine 5'-phosphate oxidase family protein [Parafrankia elaeagni]